MKLTYLNPSQRSTVLLGLLFAILFILVLWLANYWFAQQNQAGVDFLIRWLPGRLVLFEGYQNPYSLEATQQIQYFRFGRLAQPGEMPGLYLYPYYTIFITLPFLLIEDFTIARSAWMTALQLSHIMIIVITLQLAAFRPKPRTAILMLALGLVSAHLIQPIIDGNPSSLAALFLFLSIYCLSRQKDIAAGFFLALATFKPQMTVVFFAFALLWAFSHRRWRLIVAALAGVAVLMGLSFACYPAWLSAFVHQVLVYGEVASPNTPATILQTYFPQASQAVAYVLSGLCLLLIAYEWRRAYGQPFDHFLWTACFTFAILPLSGIVFGNRNFVALLPGFLLFFVHGYRRYPRKAFWLDAALLGSIVASWLSLMMPLLPMPGLQFFGFNNYLPISLLLLLAMYAYRPSTKRNPASTQQPHKA
jgi:hypothetical protein